MEEDCRGRFFWDLLSPSLFFLILQWWIFAFTAYYVHGYGAQYYAFRQSLYALFAAYIALAIHVLAMIVFEAVYRRWHLHGILAKIIYLAVFHDLFACVTFPLVFTTMESKWGHFRYFNASDPEGSWAMCNVAFFALYTFVGLVAGLIATVFAVMRFGRRAKAGDDILREFPEQSTKQG